MRYAILFTTYVWDAFVARQFDRARAFARDGDLYLAVDDTSGRVGGIAASGIPAARILRTGASDVASLVGAAGFVESGKWGRRDLLWWNLDYVTYRFFGQYPDYDYCVTMDFDACLNLDLDRVVSEIARRRIDFVAHPHGDPRTWFWARPHAPTYPPDMLRGAMLAVSVLSKPAAAHLARRRREMALAYGAGRLAFWPFCEAFVPTELAAIGFRTAGLGEFGSVADYRWRPAHLEADIAERCPDGFVHPVRPAWGEDMARPYLA